MCKRKSILISTPSKAYKTYDEAFREARALVAHIKYYCQKRNFSIYNILVGASNINPRLAEYRTVPNGIGHPIRELIQKSEKCPYVEAHLHIFIIDSEHADTLAGLIIDYLSKRHCSTINSDYRLHLRKNEIPDYDLNKVSNYITVQSKNLFSCKSQSTNQSTSQKQDKSENANLSKEQNELLFNLRFSYLLAKFLFKLSKIFNDVFLEELLNIRNQLCKASDYVKRNMLNHAYNICDDTTANLTIIRQKLRNLLHLSNLVNKHLLELESENIYKNILEKLEKQQFSSG